MSTDIIQQKAQQEAQQEQKSLSVIAKLMNKTICSLVGYYDGEIKRFTLDANNNVVLAKKANAVDVPKILIISRQYYSEQVKDYPIENRKELSKLLKLENPDKESCHYIWRHENGQSRVNIWNFSKKVPTSFIQLPESLLLGLATQDGSSKSKNVLTVENSYDDTADLYVSKQQGAIYSSLKSTMINSTQRFILSAGLSQASQQSVINHTQLVTRFTLGLPKIPLPLWSAFINRSSTKSNTPLLIKKIALPFIGVISGYLLITSGYLALKNHNLQTQLQQQGEQINLALNKQQQLDNNVIRYKLLSGFFQQQDLSLPFWLALAKVLPEVSISNIRKVDNRYVIRGTSEKATTTLEKVSQLDNVIEAKFDTPSKRFRSKERFTIGFSLQHHSLNLFLVKPDAELSESELEAEIVTEPKVGGSNG